MLRRWVVAGVACFAAVAGPTAVAEGTVGACGAPVLRAGGPTARVLTSYSVETWNMQGSSTSGECQWSLSVAPLARTNHVLALQEAGAPPASAMATGRSWTRNGYTASEYAWRPGGRRGGTYYLYWMRTDSSTGPVGRVDLAMVVPEAQRARDVRIAWDTAPRRGSVRPALGILPTGIDSWFFTVHASAQPQSGGGGRGGWDGPRIIQAIECAVAGTGRPWVAVGDWNRLPDNWAAGAGAQVAPREPTRPASGSVIDYAVVNNTLPLTGTARTEGRRGGGHSDHFPVLFTFS
ncbi:endonuclease/exonuclease/phosphatase family protein [Streptomyces sp. ISL-11]|uniref:endonuclease/exonuclease/phosphatase family protein n=1 Tax=Streptomyces sp. ISL-11 TaxID=2819174 RepID=UPI001BE8B435|nr:endonuclease/exonuclease/phosphatase family protein [Streptomyces sp. ISL-11]MBT2383623.1 endonuclease/exonuclease/phosphatase family protein [Streptomyces sp. ISL-11]